MSGHGRMCPECFLLRFFDFTAIRNSVIRAIARRVSMHTSPPAEVPGRVTPPTQQQLYSRPPVAAIPAQQKRICRTAMPSVFVKRMGHILFENEAFEDFSVDFSDSVARLASMVCTTLPWQARASQVKLFLVSKEEALKILEDDKAFDSATKAALISIYSLAEAGVVHRSCLIALVPPPPPDPTSGKSQPPRPNKFLASSFLFLALLRGLFSRRTRQFQTGGWVCEAGCVPSRACAGGIRVQKTAAENPQSSRPLLVRLQHAMAYSPFHRMAHHPNVVYVFGFRLGSRARVTKVTQRGP
jgi:hypothetical protein